MRKLNLAIIGFGRLAQRYYAPALKLQAPGAQYFIVDPDLHACEQAKRLLVNANCFVSLEALAETPLDAALIASPPSVHFEAWQNFSSRNISIFMEKPFPLPGDLSAVWSAIEVRAPFMINFNRRFWPPYQRLLQQVSLGVIGSLETAALELITDDQRWSTVGGHRGREGEGGPLQDLGGHLSDFAVRLFGSLPATVSARQSKGTPHRSILLSLHWADGRSLSARVGYGESRETVTIRGSAGELRMYNPHGRVWIDRSLRLNERITARLADAATIAGYALTPARTLMRKSTQAALAEFLRCLTTGDQTKPDLLDALRVATLLAAAEESLKLRTTLSLPSFRPSTGQGGWSSVRPQAAIDAPRD